MLLEMTRSTFILTFVNSHPKCGGASCKCKFQRGRCNEVEFLAEGGGCGGECREIFAPLLIHNEIKNNPRQYNGLYDCPWSPLQNFRTLVLIASISGEGHIGMASTGLASWPRISSSSLGLHPTKRPRLWF